MTDLVSSLPRRSKLKIDLGALARNWAFFAENAQGAECAAVVKANGYGLGLAEVAQSLADAGCKTFFVAHAFEGDKARQALGPDPVIYVLNGVMADEVSAFLAGNLRPVLNDVDQVHLWAEAGLGQHAALHIDTGMNRLGLSEEDVDRVEETIFSLNLALIMSHLACASDPQHPKNGMQRDAFVSLAARLPTAPLSLAASAGILLDGDFCFDLVRPGIGLYGGGPFDQDPVPLEPVATLEAPIIQLRSVGPGDTIGYGATWQADRRRTIATVALGYADGFLRSGSNRGFAILGGAVCPIVGRVSMDLITLDVTGAGAAAKVGAMAQFLGRAAPLDAQAQALDTIPYEILTRLGDRFERSYLED